MTTTQADLPALRVLHVIAKTIGVSPCPQSDDGTGGSSSEESPSRHDHGHGQHDRVTSRSEVTRATTADTRSTTRLTPAGSSAATAADSRGATSARSASSGAPQRTDGGPPVVAPRSPRRSERPLTRAAKRSEPRPSGSSARAETIHALAPSTGPRSLSRVPPLHDRETERARLTLVLGCAIAPGLILVPGNPAPVESRDAWQAFVTAEKLATRLRLPLWIETPAPRRPAGSSIPAARPPP